MAKSTIVPVLSTTKGYLDNPNDKAAYLLTFFIYNPGGVSDFLESTNGSLRTLAYAYQQNPTTMATSVQQKLTEIFTRNFPDRLVNVEVTSKEMDGYKYGLRFDIMSAPTADDAYVPLNLSGSFAIDDDFRISLIYTP